MAALPPEIQEPEGDLDEPDDRDSEHAQEHPGADAARRGLLGEAVAVARVHGEGGDEDERRGDVAPAEEALEVPRLVELRGDEHVRGLDRGQAQAVRDHRLPEPPGGDGPDGRQRGYDEGDDKRSGPGHGGNSFRASSGSGATYSVGPV